MSDEPKSSEATPPELRLKFSDIFGAEQAPVLAIDEVGMLSWDEANVQFQLIQYVPLGVDKDGYTVMGRRTTANLRMSYNVFRKVYALLAQNIDSLPPPTVPKPK